MNTRIPRTYTPRRLGSPGSPGSPGFRHGDKFPSSIAENFWTVPSILHTSISKRIDLEGKGHGTLLHRSRGSGLACRENCHGPVAHLRSGMFSFSMLFVVARVTDLINNPVRSQLFSARAVVPCVL